MDAALRLRISFEEKIDVPKRDQIALLNESPLVSKLTDGIVFKPLPAIFRLTCMAEIPFLYDLPETRALVAYAGETLSTQHGFTYTGNDDEIVPCYNAMLLESFVRFGLAEHPASQKALKWIKDYQVFERDEKTSWKGKGICKHGGCMKSVPCYIGIGKTVRALLTYQEFTGGNDKEIDAYIQRGVEYMLKHRLYKRLTNGEPISAHITDLMFPQSYMLSATDIAYSIGKAKVTSDSRCEDFLNLLTEKEVEPNRWKIDYRYSYEGYVPFEGRRKPSDWLSYLLPRWLD